MRRLSAVGQSLLDVGPTFNVHLNEAPQAPELHHVVAPAAHEARAAAHDRVLPRVQQQQATTRGSMLVAAVVLAWVLTKKKTTRHRR